MNRRKVHVVPDGSGGWDVKTEKSERAIKNFEDKSNAIIKAKEIAQNAPLGQIIIHDKHGVIQTEHTYKKDPEKYPG